MRRKKTFKNENYKTYFFLIVLATCTFFISCNEITINSEDNIILLKKANLSADTNSNIIDENKPLAIKKLEIPKTNPNDIVITHFAYSLLYNETHEQANWIAYELTSEETKKIFNRTNKFMPDPSVITNTANDNDYSGSGYDKGHLAPASDMGWSSTSMKESFYYSNISPQLASFNRGIWKRLEELVRTWAIENNSVYIVTGPVLTNGLPVIGLNNVSIPKYFYKVILDYTKPSIKGIGFILPNSGSKEFLSNYAVTIDSVEKFTGIDFFPLLPDTQEKIVEGTLCINCWSWKNSKTLKNKSSLSVQCSGTTKKGNRCKRKTLSSNGLCYQHGGN